MLKEGDQFCAIIPNADNLLPFRSEEDWVWRVVHKEGDVLHIRRLLPNGELDWREYIIAECMTTPIH